MSVRLNEWRGGALLLFTALLPLAVQAQEKVGSGHEDDHVCVDVRIGNESTGYLDCINAELRDVVAQQQGRQQVTQMAVQGSMPSAPSQVGVYNEAATRERLGTSFGNSVIPQRPSAPVYSLFPTRH